MPRVIHFEFNSNDPGRLAKFYQGVFGWKIEKWEGPEDYWMVTTGEEGEPGINGGIAPKAEGMTQSSVNTMGVDSVDEFAAKVVAAGGKVIQPKMAIPGVGYFAMCADPDGTFFGLMQADPAAK